MDDYEPVDPPELHSAAMFGMSGGQVEALIRGTPDVDGLWWGRTPLFEAVLNREPEIAGLLVAAGADPWLEQMDGWSPARLALAGPEPGLFGPVPPEVCLTGEEQAAVSRAERIIAVLAGEEPYAASFACVAEVGVAEVARRLKGEPVEVGDFDEWVMEQGEAEDEVVGVTAVPGGCAVVRWNGFSASTPGVMALLTAGTRGYGMYGNPKSGNQGCWFRDGAELDSDLHPGGGQVSPDDTGDEVLRIFLYQGHAMAYCCDVVGLEPRDARAFTGPPDLLLRLPAMEFWPAR
ncbi:DUF6461 domain-containing protein [Actinoplanes couchii]|uniref:Ankyrin n=1 Tax=Actinoplanes couchii TaxID=403638 RepID=A0ABQ3XK86_9ACTN|nr:DUF6461 domain-containing protein [Actinoplanes couchii]MDR6320502.1 hypothetical protein [Actinoplanes couchii]GID58907.1 hypothetical protein Aco03nite_073110 [Actinoplanes couchii]